MMDTSKADLWALHQETDALKTKIGRLRGALIITKMAIEQGNTLTTRIAANGPTIGEVINRALCKEKD